MNNGTMYLSDTIELIREVLDSGGEFRLYPKGSSMLPLIRQEKDSVLLKKRIDCPNDPLQKYEIAFYIRDNGQFVLHRVMNIEADGTYTMCGDHQLYWEKGIRKDQIIGYVAQIYKKNKILSLSSFRYRMYLKYQMCMPIRKLIFFPRRVLSFMKTRFLKHNNTKH